MAGAGMGLNARGKSWTSVPTEVEGLTKQFPDVNFGVQGVKPKWSNNPVTCRLVKNASGGALNGSLAVKYAAGKFGQEVDGVATASDKPAGITDQFLPSSGAPNGSWFWIVTEGPAEVTSSAAISANAVIATTAAGKVVTATSPPTEFDCGTAMGSFAGADAKGRAWVRLPYTGT